MERIVFRDLQGIAAVEQQLRLYDKLMKDEREALESDIASASLKYFGILEQQTYYSWLPDAVQPPTEEEWECHFDFLDTEEGEYEEENAFWNAFAIDVTDEDGERLDCLEVFGRQLVCALKRIHPEAILSFRSDGPKSDEQVAREAEAWGKSLLAKR